MYKPNFILGLKLMMCTRKKIIFLIILISFIKIFIKNKGNIDKYNNELILY
jgi:hypothetical protein